MGKSEGSSGPGTQSFNLESERAHPERGGLFLLAHQAPSATLLDVVVWLMVQVTLGLTGVTLGGSGATGVYGT
jgi:hypothetical protein